MIKHASQIPVQTPSVREKTYSLLRKQLLNGQYGPKERLTEESLAKELGVSRTPVREALHKLELEGLVKTTGARGFSVAEQSIEEMNELFEIRAVLEGYALACVCDIITKDDIRSLEIFVKKAEEAIGEGVLEKVFEYNTRFHDLLYGMIASRRPRLYGLIEDMREYVLRYRKSTLVHLDGARRSVAGHKKILMTLEMGEPHLCERIMRSHVFEARKDTLQYGE